MGALKGLMVIKELADSVYIFYRVSIRMKLSTAGNVREG